MLQKTVETIPASQGELDSRLSSLLVHLVEAEKALEAQEAATGARNAQTRVRFSTFDYSVVDPPSPSNPSASVRPLDDLVSRLGRVLESAAALRAAVSSTTSMGESSALEKQVRFLLAALEGMVRAQVSMASAAEHEQRMAAQFLHAELLALLDGTRPSKIEVRRSDLLLSLLRFEMKEIINQEGLVALNPKTGNLEQNYEDPAALFHHAVKLLAFTTSGGRLQVCALPFSSSASLVLYGRATDAAALYFVWPLLLAGTDHNDR